VARSLLDVSVPPIAEAKPIEEIPVFQDGADERESWELSQRDPLQFHLRAFRSLGPVYRIRIKGETRLVLAGLEANDFVWRNPKLWSYAATNVPFLEEMGPDHVTALDGDPHKEKRAILKTSFDQAPALRFLPQFNVGMAREIAAAAGEPADLVVLWADLITKINGKTVAQAEIPDDVVRRMARWQRQMLRSLFLEEQRPAYVARDEYRALKEEAMAWLSRIVDERLANPGKYDDNFEMTIRARADAEGGSPSRDRLVNDLYLILLAGTPNTADLVTWALQLTFGDPVWLAELRDELSTWDGRDVMALAKLPKLKATILETQRLRPGVPVQARVAVEAFDFGGYRIPAGTKILHPITLGHILEEFYPDPFDFRPRRFLETGKFVPRTFGLFGGGTHICLGRNHSLLQSPVIVAHVVKNYDVAFQDGPRTGTFVGTIGSRREREVWARLVARAA
jgi:cytochrome P450